MEHWMLLLNTTPVNSGWPSPSLQRQTSPPWNRQATFHGRSTWFSCPQRSKGPRQACKRAPVLFSRKHSSFPGWNKRPWGTVLFASACTASDAWKRRRSWGRRCSTWLSWTFRERSLCRSHWSPALNSLWECLRIILAPTLTCSESYPALSCQGCGSLVSVSRSAGALSYRSTEDSLPEILLGLIYNSATGRLSAEVIQGNHFKTAASEKPISKFGEFQAEKDPLRSSLFYYIPVVF